VSRRLVLVSEPLPECLLCETPTSRAVHEENAGLCTACNEAFHAQARRVAARGLPPAPDQVAGQLSLEGEQ
jgi:hypothetical protein